MKRKTEIEIIGFNINDLWRFVVVELVEKWRSYNNQNINGIHLPFHIKYK
ncbi:MAG: hypothetical protein K9H49_00245 [Bacteroidales bacterium]|nr:hypothetical protein [Bacteroidales bacterium]MCF8389283.1 hypothetical protein [Bacteroidales bacterium]